jgi:hypothetical protein
MFTYEIKKSNLFCVIKTQSEKELKMKNFKEITGYILGRDFNIV